MRYSRLTAAALLALTATAACSDPLEVQNQNNPDRGIVLRKPTDVEGLAGSLYQQIVAATTGGTARVNTSLMTASFENASGLANNGLGPRSGLPRGAIENNRGNAYLTENFADFQRGSQTARTASDILARAYAEGFTVGSAAADLRLRAFTYFNYGVALGNLSLIYDSAGVPRPADGPQDIPPLEGYAAVNVEAIKALDSALKYTEDPAAASAFPLPDAWLRGDVATSQALFARLVRSYRARIRAGVARTLAEREAVDWNAVIADATNGITADFNVRMDPTINWDYAWLATGTHYRDANWHQQPYHIIGMADTSGGFEQWLAVDRDVRTPFLIRTPDLRFPSGETRAAQNAVGQGAPEGRRYFRNRAPGLDQAAVGWANSQYDHYRWRSWADASRIGAFPIFVKAENDMLAAEGYIRTNKFAEAAALIDITRTLNGLPSVAGITSLTQPVPGGSACVPRIPVGPTFTTTACGNILEAMKYEKRLETAYTTLGAWFFDSRGWGDLPEGTPLEWPVPYQELDARLKPLYNLGGVGGVSAAGVSTYGYGNGTSL